MDGAYLSTFDAPALSNHAGLSQVLLYSQDGLPAGPHSMTGNLQNGQYFPGNKGGQSTCVFIDYFEYVPLPESKRNDVGIIVGTVLAVVAILVAFLCALLFWRRIRRTKETITVLQNRAPDEKWDSHSSLSCGWLLSSERALLMSLM